MSENNILKLIEKFEETLSNTEKLTDIMMGLEGALGSLDSSINEVYELTKVDELTKKSSELVSSLDNIKNTQLNINKEYEKLLNLKLYKENLKEDIKELKEYFIRFEDNINLKVENSVEEIREDINKNHIEIEENQRKLKEELLLEIKEMLESNNK